MKGGKGLYGFLAGICAGNYDVTDILVDSTLKITGTGAEVMDLLVNDHEEAGEGIWRQLRALRFRCRRGDSRVREGVCGEISPNGMQAGEGGFWAAFPFCGCFSPKSPLGFEKVGLDKKGGLHYNISVRHEVGTMTIDLRKYYLGSSDELEWDLELSGMELGGVKPFCAPVKGPWAAERLSRFRGAQRHGRVRHDHALRPLF